MSGWECVGRVDPASLSGARLALHHAAQIVAASGIAHVPAEADDSHTNMEWVPSVRALTGRLAGKARPFRLAIRPEGLRLVLLDGDALDAESLRLFGRRLDEAYAWAAGAIARFTGDEARPLTAPPWTIPPLGRERFAAGDEPALEELARWYGNAAHVLAGIADAFDGSSPVRCWPHHFDIATLLPGDAPGRTIGVGLSPGDGAYPEPYWYVAPYPSPEDPELSTLPEGGRWHRDGFFAAVLTGTDLLRGGSEHGQESRAQSFLEAAVSASARLRRG